MSTANPINPTTWVASGLNALLPGNKMFIDINRRAKMGPSNSINIFLPE